MTGSPPPPPPTSPLSWDPARDPTPAPTPAAALPAASKPRKRWLVVLVAALSVIVVMGIAGTVLFFTRSWPPLAATYDFTDDLKDGDVDAAFAQVCDRLRTSSSRSDFEQFAREIERADSVSVNLLSVDRDDDVATVEFSTGGDNDDDGFTRKLRLVYEDGDWRPCGTSRA